MFNNDLIMHLGRMCDAHPGCNKCPIHDKLDSCYACSPDAWMKSGIDIVDIVEKWAADHPVITNKEKFEEVFGVEFPEDTDPNYVQLARKWLDAEYKEPKEKRCSTCKHQPLDGFTANPYCDSCYNHEKWEAKTDNERALDIGCITCKHNEYCEHCSDYDKWEAKNG